MESVINLENFYFAYKKSDLVLRDINFEIKKGSFTVITGPSGAGKTTLCKAMTGIVPYYMGGRYSGDVKINGESTKGKRVSDIAMRVGFIMEDYESQLDELSGGQRQRLLLAATLAVHPEIIVLDEPVSAMDPDGARSLYKLVDKIHKQYGTTIIAVEHRVDYVLPYVTDMIVLNEGELVAADAFEAAAPKMYENPALRPLLPSLWQIKLGLEEKLGVDLGDWRSEEDALADFRTYGIVAAEGRAD